MRKTIFTIVGALAIIASSYGGTYKVKSGETFIGIAHKLGVDSNALKAANPGINTHKLKLGQVIKVPTKSKSSSKTTKTVAQSKSSKTASKKTATKTVSYSGGYKVAKNDNDWIIARRMGITVTQLHKANPGVNWKNLQIGQAIRKPGAARPTSASNVAKIRSRNAVISKDAVTIRRAPSTSSSKVTMVDQGTRVTVLDRSGDWYKLKFPKGTVGWVRGDMLKAVSASQVAKTSTKKPSSSSRVAYRAPKRDTGVAGGSLGTTNALVKTGMSMLGTRYRYGSMSRSATDCSGFTTQVFARHGIKLPRTSREQSKVGTGVSKGSLRPGDLVFFHTGRSSRINHVGMYIGGGKFIHSSSGKGCVRIDSINDGYYQSKYVTARRVAGASRIAAKAEAEEMKAKAKATDVTAPADTPAVEPTQKNPTAPTGGVDDIGK